MVENDFILDQMRLRQFANILLWFVFCKQDALAPIGAYPYTLEHFVYNFAGIYQNIRKRFTHRFIRKNRKQN
jgi:hypothetical protein